MSKNILSIALLFSSMVMKINSQGQTIRVEKFVEAAGCKDLSCFKAIAEGNNYSYESTSATFSESTDRYSYKHVYSPQYLIYDIPRDKSKNNSLSLQTAEEEIYSNFLDDMKNNGYNKYGMKQSSDVFPTTEYLYHSSTFPDFIIIVTIIQTSHYNYNIKCGRNLYIDPALKQEAQKKLDEEKKQQDEEKKRLKDDSDRVQKFNTKLNSIRYGAVHSLVAFDIPFDTPNGQYPGEVRPLSLMEFNNRNGSSIKPDVQGYKLNINAKDSFFFWVKDYKQWNIFLVDLTVAPKPFNLFIKGNMIMSTDALTVEEAEGDLKPWLHYTVIASPGYWVINRNRPAINNANPEKDKERQEEIEKRMSHLIKSDKPDNQNEFVTLTVSANNSASGIVTLQAPLYSYTGNVSGGYAYGAGVLKLINGYTYSGWFAYGRANGGMLVADDGSKLFARSFTGFSTTSGFTAYKTNNGDIIFNDASYDPRKVRISSAGDIYFACKYSLYYEDKEATLGLMHNGDLYLGEFANGKFNGQGTLQTASGSKITGSFTNGLADTKNGAISITKKIYPNGDIYLGEFMDGKKNGLGILKLKNGDIYYGQFSNDQYKGAGIFKYKSGLVLVTTFADGQIQFDYEKKTGVSLLKYPNNKIVFGNMKEPDVTTKRWDALQPYGESLIQYPNGDFLEGYFTSPGKIAVGVTYTNKGEMIDVKFNNGLLDGPGKIYSLDGKIKDVVYKNGVLQ